MSRRRRRFIVAAIVAFPILFYLGCVHRYHETVEKDGWVLKWNCPPFRCPHCSGRIEQFTAHGNPVACPADSSFATVPKTKLTVQSPVCTVVCLRGEDAWRILAASDTRPTDICGNITPEEMTQGYYDAGTCRKRGTPADWCLASSEEYCRWINPRLIDALPW